MQLSLKEAARLLQVKEKRVYQWINARGLPARQINGQLGIHLTEILEWTTANKVSVDSEMLARLAEQGISIPSISEALQAGGIHYGVCGADRFAILQRVTELLPLASGAERAEVLELLYAREKLGTTSVGNGIAIPHARFPLVCGIHAPLVTLCFLNAPADFCSLDGELVRALFLLLSPTPRVHLQMLSRLASALNNELFLHSIRSQAAAETIIACARRLDTGAQGETSPPV